MWDASGRYGVVYNGEIYNFPDLKAALGDYPWRSKSDTEVLLAGFAAWGTDLFRRLNGIFAFALYDKQEGCVYLVRDRFGIKPLYYYENDGVLLAASEQRAILHTGLLQKKLHPEALCDFFWNGCVSGENRLMQGVRQLPAGHWARMDAGGLRRNAFYRLSQSPAQEIPGDPQTLKKELLHLLQQAVSRQLMSDVPLGAFLSGGIDSSAVVALMSEVSSGRPLTFTVGFEENKYDESEYALQIAQKFNTEHTLLTLRARDFLDALPEALNAMDTITMDGVNTYVVSKITRNAGVTVALSGLGGDELFAGYQTFKRYAQWREKFWWHLPQLLRQGLSYPLSHWATTPYYRRIGDNRAW
jgi:asparagine synthase (glutamine-hydrolysing)